jgi:hypothetical protein
MRNTELGRSNKKGKRMTRNLFRLAVTTAFALATSPVLAAPVVDGTVNTGEYGGATASVLTNPAAPESNFGSPGSTAKAGYDIFLTDTNDTLFGAVSQTGGTSAGSFSNLYFDIDPTTGTGGSELGIEVTNKRGFVAGTSNFFDLSPYITYSSTTLDGLTTTEFSIANSAFRDFIAGAQAQGFFGASGYTPQDVRLNLSQSLSYSVAGGPAYGAQGLGTFSVANAVSPAPEPATWAMMIFGFGMTGAAMRSRKSAVATRVSYAV